MKLRELGCYVRAIPLWARHKFNPDWFCPHIMVEKETFRQSIFVKPDGKFRFADSLTHDIDEKYYYMAYLTGCECKRCGHKELSFSSYSPEELEKNYRKMTWRE